MNTVFTCKFCGRESDSHDEIMKFSGYPPGDPGRMKEVATKHGGEYWLCKDCTHDLTCEFGSVSPEGPPAQELRHLPHLQRLAAVKHWKRDRLNRMTLSEALTRLLQRQERTAKLLKYIHERLSVDADWQAQKREDKAS